MLPLLAGIVWLGLYPAPVLRRMEAAAGQYVEIVRPHLGAPVDGVRLGVSPEVAR
jgi:hypothetical protein